MEFERGKEKERERERERTKEKEMVRDRKKRCYLCNINRDRNIQHEKETER